MVNYLKQFGEQMVSEGGFSIVPLNGKIPKLANWPRHCAIRPSETEVQEWIDSGRHTGIGLPAGEANGLCFLDVDSFTPALCEAIKQWLPFASVWRVGAKGYVIPVRWENQHHQEIQYKGIIIAELICDGQQVAALSTHPSTERPYVWHGIELENATLSDLQSAAITLTNESFSKLEQALNAQNFDLDERDLAKIKVPTIGKVGVGGRANKLKSMAGASFAKGGMAEETAKALVDFDKKHHETPYFSDPSEGTGEPYDRAINFVYSVFMSLRKDRQRKGEAMPEAEKPLDWKSVVIPDFPDQNDNGKRLNTLDNYIEMFKRLRVVCRYNETTKQDEVILPGLKMSQANALNVVLAHLTSWAERCRLPTKNVKQYINAISDMNAYSPIKEWIESKPWDGVERLPMLYSTVTAVGEEKSLETRVMKERLIELWITSAVAAVFKPGSFSAHGVLVFLGAQNMGKTRWFKRLLPDTMRKYAIDGLVLDVHNKDSIMRAISHWLAELGEVDGTIRRSDVAALKAFITQDKDVQRRPFAPCDSHYPRQTVFFASVNDRKFLNDPTGNRRFWTIDCEKIDHSHDIDMQQVFAEVLVQWRKGAKTYLSQNELEALNEHNEEFTVIHPLEEQILNGFPWDNPKAKRHLLTATDIAQKLGVMSPTQADTRVVARVMKDRFKQKEKRTNRGRFYEVPLPDSSGYVP